MKNSEPFESQIQASVESFLNAIKHISTATEKPISYSLSIYTDLPENLLPPDNVSLVASSDPCGGCKNGTTCKKVETWVKDDDEGKPIYKISYECR